MWSRAVSDNLWISSEAGATGFVQENCDLPASNQCSTPITPIIPCHQIVAQHTKLYNTVPYYIYIQHPGNTVPYNTIANRISTNTMSIHIKALIPPKEPGIAPQKRNYEARAKVQKSKQTQTRKILTFCRLRISRARSGDYELPNKGVCCS